LVIVSALSSLSNCTASSYIPSGQPQAHTVQQSSNICRFQLEPSSKRQNNQVLQIEQPDNPTSSSTCTSWVTVYPPVITPTDTMLEDNNQCGLVNSCTGITVITSYKKLLMKISTGTYCSSFPTRFCALSEQSLARFTSILGLA